MKKVSVIVPSYCHAPFLRARLDSVFAQDYPEKEVILLDDASTDESQQILREYADRPEVTQVVMNTQNSGNTFLQWQKGLELATGDYVWIAESDDTADTRLLSELVKRMEEDGNGSMTALAYTRSKRIDQDGRELPSPAERWELKDFSMDGTDFARRHLLGYNHICNASAVLFDRASAMQIDMQDVAAYRASGDRLFWIRLAEKGMVKYVSEPLSYFRQHTNKVSARAVQNGNNIVQDHQIYQKVKQETGLSHIERLLVCGYHWRAILQPSVSQEGRIAAGREWSKEPEYGRFSYWMYLLTHLTRKIF